MRIIVMQHIRHKYAFIIECPFAYT